MAFFFFFALSKALIFLSFLSNNFSLYIRPCVIWLIPMKNTDFSSSRQFNFRLIILNLRRPRFTLYQGTSMETWSFSQNFLTCQESPPNSVPSEDLWSLGFRRCESVSRGRPQPTTKSLFLIWGPSGYLGWKISVVTGCAHAGWEGMQSLPALLDLRSHCSLLTPEVAAL